MVDYQELWDRRAQFFDVDYSDYDQDIEFFKDYTDQQKRICELGCGTFRIADLLHGHYEKFYGVDLSENMLVQGLENLTSEIKESVEAIQSGMQSFRLPERVDLIFNMGNSFLMLKDEKKEDTLSHVVDALRDDGEFVLEIYNPNEWRKKPEDHFLHLRTIDDEESDTHVTLSYTQSINEEESYNKIIWYREEVKKQSREVLKDVFPIKFHFLEFDDAKAMIEKFFLLRKYMEVSRTTISIQMNRKG